MLFIGVQAQKQRRKGDEHEQKERTHRTQQTAAHKEQRRSQKNLFKQGDRSLFTQGNGQGFRADHQVALKLKQAEQDSPGITEGKHHNGGNRNAQNRARRTAEKGEERHDRHPGEGFGQASRSGNILNFDKSVPISAPSGISGML